MPAETFNFKYLGNIDTSSIREKIENAPWKNKWSTLRQSFKTHKHCDVIPLRWNRNFDDAAHVKAEKTKFYDEFYDKKFFEELKLIMKNSFGEGYFIRILFVNLCAKEKIRPHTDSGESLIKNHRVHIPIKSNPKVEFTIYTKILQKKISGEKIILTKPETKFMKEGEIWEINNVKEHSVANNSEQNRIHLIVDWHSSV